MKNKNKFHGNQYALSHRDKRKLLAIWFLLIITGFCIVNSQLTILYLPDNVAHARQYEGVQPFDDKLSDVLTPPTEPIKRGVDPERGIIPSPRLSDVSAYTSRVQETDDTPCIAANGKDICALHAKGIQTCASNDYKLGTVLSIQGMGECIVSDRMNRRYTGTGRVDWYMGMDLQGALKHGVKKLNVSVIN